jgi:hypothetical protein
MPDCASKDAPHPSGGDLEAGAVSTIDLCLAPDAAWAAHPRRPLPISSSSPGSATNKLKKPETAA